jgi:alpha-N-acetylglucosaminidase
MSAWSDLASAVYKTRYWTPRWWKSRAGAYLFFKRPTLDVTEFAGAPGDRALLRKAIEALLKLAPAFGESSLFQNDVVAATCHFVSGELDACLQAAVSAYSAGDLARGDDLVSRLKVLVLGVDALIGGQQETLATWIADARAYGDTPAESAYYVANAKAQVAVWGGKGNLNDYASKAWQGMYAGFYLPRWTQFLAELRRSAQAGTPFDQAAFTSRITAWEHDWVKADTAYARHIPGRVSWPDRLRHDRRQYRRGRRGAVRDPATCQMVRLHACGCRFPVLPVRGGQCHVLRHAPGRLERGLFAKGRQTDRTDLLPGLPDVLVSLRARAA